MEISAVAVLVELAAVVVVVAAAGAGHGSYLPAKLLFPWTMLLATEQITGIGIALALV